MDDTTSVEDGESAEDVEEDAFSGWEGISKDIVAPREAGDVPAE